ncbi:MAG: type II toxin-antitoxin system VapC family toxin [Gemmatimonadaceae bacterium]
MTPARRRARRSVTATAPVTELAPRRLLLDTHVWLWWQADDVRLGPRTRDLVQRASEVRFSAASAWEIAIKVAIGKLTLPANADITDELLQSGFLSLPVEVAHADDVRRLPPLHGDPFDRLLIAQSRLEGLTLVTADRQLAAYDITVIDATH